MKNNLIKSTREDGKYSIGHLCKYFSIQSTTLNDWIEKHIPKYKNQTLFTQEEAEEIIASMSK